MLSDRQRKMRARIFVCHQHDDIHAAPWDGGDLFDFDVHDQKCTPGSRNCLCELLCVAQLTDDGMWTVAESEMEEWTHLDNKSGKLQKWCEQRYDVNLTWVQQSLDALKH